MTGLLVQRSFDQRMALAHYVLPGFGGFTKITGSEGLASPKTTICNTVFISSLILF